MAPPDGATKLYRGHTDLNHGPIGLQPIALPLSYIPNAQTSCDSKVVCIGRRGTLYWTSPMSQPVAESVSGITVSIAAFQAVDPGSTPG